MINVSSGEKLQFSSQLMSLAIDRSTQQGDLAEQIDAFASSAKELSDVVIDQLGLADFARIGCRRDLRYRIGLD